MELGELLRHLAENRFGAASAVLFVVGLAGMLFNRNLFKKVVSMGFMDSAIFLFLSFKQLRSTGVHLVPCTVSTWQPGMMSV